MGQLLLQSALGLLLVLGVACPFACAADTQAEQHSMPHLDLTKASIEPKLTSLPADDAVLIEFFASWCPACRWVGKHL